MAHTRGDQRLTSPTRDRSMILQADIQTSDTEIPSSDNSGAEPSPPTTVDNEPAEQAESTEPRIDDYTYSNWEGDSNNNDSSAVRTEVELGHRESSINRDGHGIAKSGNTEQVSSVSSDTDQSTNGDFTPMEDIQLYDIDFLHAEYGMEDLNRYSKGGFHPVVLEDILDGRYKVVGKLGSGGFGTVWMCRELNLKWVAIKILAADHSLQSRETTTFERLQETSSSDELEQNHIGVPLESFWIEGPNGRHLAFVMPIHGPGVGSWRNGRDDLSPQDLSSQTPATVTDICGQITQGLSFLHDRGICHGDFRPWNILVKLDQRGLNELSEEQMDELLGEQEGWPVETISGEKPDERAPEYLVVPVAADWCHGLLTKDIVITDFGESFPSSNPRPVTGIPIAYAAPENLFRQEPRLEADLWSLACTLYEVRTGTKLFGDVFTFSGVVGVEDIVRQQEIMLGPLPQPYRAVFDDKYEVERVDIEIYKNELTATWTLSGLETARLEDTKDTNFDDVLQANIFKAITAARSSHAQPEESQEYSPREEVLAIADTIHSLLRWEPSQRTLARNVLQMEWLKNTSPARVASCLQERVLQRPETPSSETSDTGDIIDLISPRPRLDRRLVASGVLLLIVTIYMIALLIGGNFLMAIQCESFIAKVSGDSRLTGEKAICHYSVYVLFLMYFSEIYSVDTHTCDPALLTM
ncbi:kinase-like domain-containing protein [Xylariaceae sp. FL1272]|nr:kinase-like domain-containing protein [Xylariaceae sp. FL1272]